MGLYRPWSKGPQRGELDVGRLSRAGVGSYAPAGGARQRQPDFLCQVRTHRRPPQLKPARPDIHVREGFEALRLRKRRAADKGRKRFFLHFLCKH